MVTSPIKQEIFGNITDYSEPCPPGLKSYYAFFHFTDGSYCLYSNIFASNRAVAYMIALHRFEDCIEYISGFSLAAVNPWENE